TVDLSKVAVAQTGPAQTVFDRRQKAVGHYGFDSKGIPFGLWPDGPIHPWKNHRNEIFFNIPHSENYAVRVPDWNRPETWTLVTNKIFDSRLTVPGPTGGQFFHQGGHCNTHIFTEADYDNRLWLMGFWSEGSVVSAIAHHEWYRECDRGYITTANRKWITGIHHLTSSDGGASFLPQAYRPFKDSQVSNGQRMVIVPEPFDVQKGNALYGFLHPSNIVKEGNYFYATADYREYHGERGDPNHPDFQPNGGADVLDSGFVMFRTTNIRSPQGWQLYTPNGWQTMNGYQGNLGQKPYIFFNRRWNPYLEHHKSTLMATSLHYHRKSKLWVAFGLDGSKGNTILLSRSLANPEWESNGSILIQGLDGSNVVGPYISVIDHDASDRNYVNIDNDIHIYGMKDYEYYYRIPITLTLPDAVSEPQPQQCNASTKEAACPIANGNGRWSGRTCNTSTGQWQGGTCRVTSCHSGYQPNNSGTACNRSAPAPLPVSAPRGPWMINGQSAIYFGTYNQYCWIPDMEMYKDLTGSYDVTNIKVLNSMPSGLTYNGNCRFPVGQFFVGTIDIYFAYGNNICRLANMNEYARLTGRTEATGIPRFNSLPSGFIYQGICQ
ncbi:MAG: hypothetical protein KDD43_04795, partial [Bdellovibrionales bacterium]|nr:hypothetical protein [Bdellovibrionales bacterium]